MTKTFVGFGQNCVDQSKYGWPGNLKNPINDCRELVALFARLGYESSGYVSGWNIGRMPGEPGLPPVQTLDCTLDRWKQIHANLQAKAQPGDIIVIGNSGHGGQYDNVLEGRGETICFADGELRDDQMHQILAGYGEGVNVLVIADWCYSGEADRRRRERFEVRARPYWVDDNILDFEPQTRKEDHVIKANVLWFAACRGDETASDGADNGAWTASLLQTAQGIMVPEGWFGSAATICTKHYPDQHPQIHLLGKDPQRFAAMTL